MHASSPKLEPLQALRGIAATLIMAKHALYEVDFISSNPFSYGNYNAYVLGIDVFFVLSGFIMVYTSWNKQGVAAAKDFMFRRILRIVPLYWFYTFLLLFVALILPQVLDKASYNLPDFLKSLFFIPYINSAGDDQPFLANGWTLNYEMYFYAIFALCLLLPVRYSLIVLTVYFCFTVGTKFMGIGGVVLTYYSDPIVLEFVAGAIIGWLFMTGRRFSASIFWFGVAFLAGAIITAVCFNHVLIDVGIRYPREIIAVVAVALLVLPKDSENIRMPRWSVFLGDASYTIYLSHAFGIGAITQFFVMMGLSDAVSPWIIFACVASGCLLGGAVAYLLIEKPLLSAMKGLVYNLPKQTVTTHEKTI